MNERVVNDIESGAYFIIHDNVLYIFVDVSLKESEYENGSSSHNMGNFL